VKQRALLLINPHSRRGQATRRNAKLALEELGLDLLEVDFDTPDQFPDLINRHRHDVDLVIVGGGDGSMNGAIEGLLDTKLPLGVIPLGTANNLARCLNLPLSLMEACRVIAQGHTRTIDLGWVNGEYFFNVAGLGLSTRINREVSSDFKRRWGALAYVVTAFKLIFKQRRFYADIRCNGDVIRVQTYQITICNGRHYGSGLTVAADAAIDDCRLDLCSLEVQHWWQAPFLLPALSQGKYATGRGIRILQSNEIDIYTDKRQAIDTDGEVTVYTPATFRVIPQVISVFVPKPV
jgi:diacylglycerol kinase (ATP)